MNSRLFSIALAQATLVTFGLLGDAVAQNAPIVRALPVVSPAVPYYQDGSTPQDGQSSPSDRQEPSATENPGFDSQSEDEVDLSSLFKEGQWPLKSIRAISLDVREKNEDAPKDLTTKLLDRVKGRWSSFTPTPKVYAWAAPNIQYQPLYFEDVALERYGQTKSPGRQAIRSGVHFFTSVGLLPWHLCQDPPNSCDYPLGFCRPGDDVPCTKQKLFYHHAEK